MAGGSDQRPEPRQRLDFDTPAEPAKVREGYANFAIAEQARLAAAGLASDDKRDTICCYAKQNKFWVEGTANCEQWEIYTVLEDSATFYGDDTVAAARWGPAAESSGTGESATSPRCC